MHEFYNILLLKILDEIIPATRKSIIKGNKIFGAAIINKINYETVTIGTNNEIANPLYHGEISAINNYFASKNSKNIKTSDCIFLSTHEPCSLCLSAITWSGFNNFYYFFPYSETKNKFDIPHDLKILNEVFNIKKGHYKKSNFYWKSHSILDEISNLRNIDIYNFQNKITDIYSEYKKLSNLYQKNKKLNNIPLN